MLENFKNIFFEPVEKKDTLVTDNGGNVQPITPPILQPINTTIGVVDDKFITHFNKLITDADINLTKPDYIDFKQAIDNMSNLALDETTKYAVVYATLATQGLTKEKLLSTLNSYIQLISNDKTRFEASINEKISSDITNRSALIGQNQDLILQYNAQIDELKAKIDESTQSIIKYQNEQKEITDKINKNSANYTATQTKFLTDLNTSVQKITNLL